jgi:uncharacterized membrane protein
MDIMNDEDAIVLIAPYEEMADGQRDFGALRTQLREKRFEVREAVLVTKGADGEPHVVEIGNRHARSGASWGAGVGLLVGLLIPPFIASVAVGAAAGVLVAKVADHGLRAELQHHVGEALVVGTGVIVAMVKPDSRVRVEHALPGAVGFTALDFAGATIASLEAAITDALARPHAVTPPV